MAYKKNKPYGKKKKVLNKKIKKKITGKRKK